MLLIRILLLTLRSAAETELGIFASVYSNYWHF